jgi:hypothetical protein
MGLFHNTSAVWKVEGLDTDRTQETSNLILVEVLICCVTSSKLLNFL